MSLGLVCDTDSCVITLSPTLTSSTTENQDKECVDAFVH